MGRSVSIPSGAVLVAYDYLEAPKPTCFHCGEVEAECECSVEDGFGFEAHNEDELWLQAQDDFSWYMDDISDRAGLLWPSLREAGPSAWAGREDRVLRENRFAQFGISEYCGLVAIWIRPRPDHERPKLAEAWCFRIADKFQREFGRLYRVATFSNGEAVFRRSA